MDILLGLQWGDEGKGKIVDFLAPKYDIIARFQGGPNAGHTLHFDGKKHVLHQIPSGIFHTQIQNIIGNGVVFDPVIFKTEIQKLQDRGLVPTRNLFISKKAQVILPTHRMLDAAQERNKGKDKIGSTLKGISPAYQDKIARAGLRVGDLFEDDFEDRYDRSLKRHLQMLQTLGYEVDLAQEQAAFFSAVKFLREFKGINSEYMISKALDEGKSVLAEGAQGTLLDIDFGSYPFVTSSNTTASGACSGLGVAPNRIKKVLGIFKAYCTRVGSGPFPTELHDKTGEKLREQGAEFGATTGRPRRCGWLDLPALRYAVMINGVTELLMMKTDVLSAFDQVEICTHYELPDGSHTQELPYDLCETEIKPIYQKFEGWGSIPKNVEKFEDLHPNLQKYIAFVEAQTGVGISLISFGPDRTETLMR
ncbi:MAG: adenylosuccinate synthase [Bernardetiaceae bacterium]|nr:adenylosuccinate synthase [Bernardetiaceae bacterium]